MNSILVLFLLSFFVWGVFGQNTTTYYVSSSLNNSTSCGVNNSTTCGSYSCPCSTIQDALDKINSTQLEVIISILPGNYSGTGNQELSLSIIEEINLLQFTYVHIKFRIYSYKN